MHGGLHQVRPRNQSHVIDVMHVEGRTVRAVWRAGEDEGRLPRVGWPSPQRPGHGGASAKAASKTKNPDMKPGPAIPQRTSGHDDPWQDSRIS